jgi:hypothetical protein
MSSFTTIAYLSSNVIRMIKFKRIREKRQAARKGQIEMYTKFCSDNLNGRNNFVLSKRMREINISMEFIKSGWESVELIKSREASGELLALEKDSALRVY